MRLVLFILSFMITSYGFCPQMEYLLQPVEGAEIEISINDTAATVTAKTTSYNRTPPPNSDYVFVLRALMEDDTSFNSEISLLKRKLFNKRKLINKKKKSPGKYIPQSEISKLIMMRNERNRDSVTRELKRIRTHNGRLSRKNKKQNFDTLLLKIDSLHNEKTLKNSQIIADLAFSGMMNGDSFDVEEEGKNYLPEYGKNSYVRFFLNFSILNPGRESLFYPGKPKEVPEWLHLSYSYKLRPLNKGSKKLLVYYPSFSPDSAALKEKFSVSLKAEEGFVLRLHTPKQHVLKKSSSEIVINKLDAEPIVVEIRTLEESTWHYQLLSILPFVIFSLCVLIILKEWTAEIRALFAK